MAKAAYPIGTDLSAYLLQAGFSAAFLATYDLSLAALSGWEAFNRQAGRPMLAVTQTREFDRPMNDERVLNLRGDLATLTSVVDDGNTLDATRDFRPEPLNAPDDGLPYDRIKFWRSWYWQWPRINSVLPPLAVTGSWGYGATIPDDAWMGMLALAALALHPLIAQARSQGMVMWREADMSESYGPKPLQGLYDAWLAQAMMTAGGFGPDRKYHAGRYTRVTVG